MSEPTRTRKDQLVADLRPTQSGSGDINDEPMEAGNVPEPGPSPPSPKAPSPADLEGAAPPPPPPIPDERTDIQPLDPANAAPSPPAPRVKQQRFSDLTPLEDGPTREPHMPLAKRNSLEDMLSSALGRNPTQQRMQQQRVVKFSENDDDEEDDEEENDDEPSEDGDEDERRDRFDAKRRVPGGGGAGNYGTIGHYARGTSARTASGLSDVSEEDDHLVSTLAFKAEKQRLGGGRGLNALMENKLRAGRMGGGGLGGGPRPTSGAPPPSAPLLRLDVVKGKGMLGMSFTCDAVDYSDAQGDRPEITLGRVDSNHMVLHDPEVSSRHAALKWASEARAWQIIDLGSLNGTHVNDDKISSADRGRGAWRRLADGDLLRLGHSTVLKVTLINADKRPAGHAGPGVGDGDGSPGAGALDSPRGPGGWTLRPQFLDSVVPEAGAPSYGVEIGRPFGDIQHVRCSVLGLQCALVSRTGRDHLRENKPREDQVFCHLPLVSGTGAMAPTPAAAAATAPPTALAADAPSVSPLDSAAAAQSQLPLADRTIPSPLASASSMGRDLPVVAAMGVLDGHAGPLCAAAARRILPHELAESIRMTQGEAEGPSGFSEALKDGFLSADDVIMALPGPDADQGCTATVLLAWRHAPRGAIRLQAANVGDSMCYIGRIRRRVNDGGGAAPEPSTTANGAVDAAVLVPGAAEDLTAPPAAPAPAISISSFHCLTSPHRLTEESERQRLRAAGIPISEGQTRLMGLALVRTLGDKVFKEEYPTGVIAEPTVSDVVEIPPGEEAIMIVGSDGVWDFLSRDAVFDTITASVCESQAQEASGGGSNMAPIVRAAASLVRKVEQRSMDDFSITVALIKA